MRQDLNGRRDLNWRRGAIPGWMLAIGLVAFVVVSLALASAGGTGGIVAVAVVEAAFVALLYSWCAAPARRATEPDD